MSLTEPPLVLDADILSHFARVGRLDLLDKLFHGNMLVLDHVLNELERHPRLGPQVNEFVQECEVKIQSIIVTDPEAIEISHLIEKGQMGRGEAACMAYLKYNEGSFASNNLADIHNRCLEKKIDLYTTPRVIKMAYEQKIISLKEANDIWASLLRQKQKLPVESFSVFIGCK